MEEKLVGDREGQISSKPIYPLTTFLIWKMAWERHKSILVCAFTSPSDIYYCPQSDTYQ